MKKVFYISHERINALESQLESTNVEIPVNVEQAESLVEREKIAKDETLATSATIVNVVKKRAQHKQLVLGPKLLYV